MTTENFCLIYSAIFVLLAWAPASLGKVQGMGWNWIFSNREEAADPNRIPVWAARAERAHANLLAYYPAFIVAVLIIDFTKTSTKWTASICVVYLISRILNFAAYVAGVPSARIFFWLVALLCNLFLLLSPLL